MVDTIYSVASNTSDGVVFAEDLAAELRALSLSVSIIDIRISEADDKIIIITDASLSSGDQTIIEAALSAHGLAGARRAKNNAIDQKTEEIIGNGFVFKTQAISLSLRCQSTINALYEARADLTYPISICNKANTATVTIDSVGEMAALHAEMLGAVMSARNNGVTLKAAVIAATTIAEVAAVVDGR